MTQEDSNSCVWFNIRRHNWNLAECIKSGLIGLHLATEDTYQLSNLAKIWPNWKHLSFVMIVMRSDKLIKGKLIKRLDTCGLWHKPLMGMALYVLWFTSIYQSDTNIPLETMVRGSSLAALMFLQLLLHCGCTWGQKINPSSPPHI